MIKAYLLENNQQGQSTVTKGFVQKDISSVTKSISFAKTEAGAQYDWHTAPTMQYVLTLVGKLTFTTSLGEVFSIEPGDVLIAADTEGKGHKWALDPTSDWVRAYIPFENMSELNFIADE